MNYVYYTCNNPRKYNGFYTMKKGKELKMDTHKDFSIVYGSVNNKSPRTLYINISAWAQPRQELDGSYTRIIKDLHKKVKQNLYDFIEETFDTDFHKHRNIVDVDLRESGVRFGKRSFVNCEITLFLKESTPVNSDKIRYMLDELVANLISTSFEGSRYFRFHRKKI